ncbi:PREDICTED: THAP domain-containing protein 11-like [Cyphomyrmex costatus]|uniref:THAP domain-containing protein 11-like n=1 Tax=Cyphomyrmex costatus TaxID=456900 RepID=UPI00085231FB|nr:PREDICTED: THAP domain-containing protein 11-like [Cyphomyrmex costatus]
MEKNKNSGKWCCVPSCKWVKGDNISLHYFPKDKDLRKKWTIACKIGKPVTPYMQVCGRHFSDYHFAGGAHAKVRRLKTSIAVPTLFLPRRPLDRIPTDKQKKETEERAERLNRRQYQVICQQRH